MQKLKVNAVSRVKKQFKFGDNNVTLETGEIARQADGCVIIDIDGTSILVSVVGVKDNSIVRDFFPLTINYQERTYAAGKIPGGFFKREGRPSEKETLTARLIDRPLRPLFPAGFTNEVQVVCTVISVNADVDTDVPAMLGASAALAVSGLPFNGPVGAARVGYKDGEYILNPSQSDMEDSQLDLVVAGTDNAVLMVESEAKELPEDVMLGAVMFGHSEMQTVITAIQEFADEVGATPWDWSAPEKDQATADAVSSAGRDDLTAAYKIADKQDRYAKLSAARSAIKGQLIEGDNAGAVEGAIESLEKDIVRGSVLSSRSRIDGRDLTTVRPISIRTGVIPRTHGSALFTRGETQALVVTTLGTGRDSQIIDSLQGEKRDNFLLHYNFPPYCVGETGMVGNPKRREIGHGKLAKRGMLAVMPTMDDFPYVVRVVSEITESNGSSSMASVCGSSLALMDAGVPIKSPVAGIAMGLIKEGEEFAVLTDIMGDEDHLGDMDFKVAGTVNGINALQMDIKIDGITEEIMDIALGQAKDARLHILGEMTKAIDSPREEMSEYAPRIVTIKINPDKIRDVIGKGGVTIRTITEETGASIDISDEGIVKIASIDKAAGDEAKKRIELITADVEVGKIYEGKVERIMDFGAFVNILPGRDGLLHISQISEERVEKVSDKLSEGDMIKVKVLEIDKQGRIRLSVKAIQVD